MLTEETKERARHHMGYIQVGQGATFYLGIPAGVQTQFTIERAFNLILPGAEPRLVRLLDKLDKIEEEIEESTPNVEASKVGEIELNPKAFRDLIQRYRFFQGGIANLLGVPPNPFDDRPFLGQGYNRGGTVNSPVSG